MGRESKLAKMVWSGSVAPCSVNNDYITVLEIMTISDVRSLIALCIRIVRCSLGHGLLCDVWLYELHPQKAVGLLLVMCWVSPERREYSMSTAVAAAPARQNDRICSSCGSWSFLPASLLAPCLPWIQQTAHT